MANPLKLLKLKADGFQFIQELPIDAPPKKVWASLLNVDRWFGFEPGGERWFTNTLDAKPGGQWLAKGADGSQRYFGVVTHLEPHKLLRIAGPLGMTHLPVNNVFIFELQPRDGGKSTLLRLGQRTFGFLTSDVKKNVFGGWKRMLVNLKMLAEKR